MLEGITILNQTEIVDITTRYAGWAFCLLFGGLIAAAIFCVLGEAMHGAFHIGTVIAIVCIFIGLAMIVDNDPTKNEHTGRYQYEVLIDESVSFEAVLKKYDVVEQKGKIWILEDKDKDEDKEKGK